MAEFTYIYKSSDGVRHEAEIGAPSRDEAFAALRERGIRPIKVLSKDGSRANGEMRGVRRRVVVGFGLCCLFIGGLVVFWLGRSAQEPRAEGLPANAGKEPTSVDVARPLERQFIPGDRRRLEGCATKLFLHPLEVALAGFAEPGRPAAAPAKLPAGPEMSLCLGKSIRILSTDFTEHVDLKRIVAGMKEEMRSYLAKGGTARGYFSELIKRQRLEVAYREKAERRLDELLKAKDMDATYDFWLKANARLKSMGIYELPLPDELREQQMSDEF